MKILSDKKYNEIIDVLSKQHELLIKQDKLITKLNTENSILNHTIAAQNIDFPNSTNYQLADFETDFPGFYPEDIF